MVLSVRRVRPAADQRIRASLITQDCRWPADLRYTAIATTSEMTEAFLRINMELPAAVAREVLAEIQQIISQVPAVLDIYAIFRG